MKYCIDIKLSDGEFVEENDFITNMHGLVDLVALYTEHTSCRFLRGETNVEFNFTIKCLKEE